MKIFSHVLAFQENKETCFRRKGGRPIGNGKSAGTEVEKAVQGSTEALILSGRTACVNWNRVKAVSKEEGFNTTTWLQMYRTEYILKSPGVIKFICFPGRFSFIHVYVCQPPPCFHWKHLWATTDIPSWHTCLPTGCRQIMLLFHSDLKSTDLWPLTPWFLQLPKTLSTLILMLFFCLKLPHLFICFLSSTQRFPFTAKGTSFLTVFPWEASSHRYLQLHFQCKALL